ncbi:MAG: diaminopimelate epimerase [Christensenellaceae bacterium]|nr:diaminopimelate epimerase [Christensenellaceae bacterium]
MQIIKMHGLGNDFIVIDNRNGQVKDPCALGEKLCHRRLAVGGDGLVLVENSDVADIRMRIINSDGSEAEMCGNGIRCFARFVYDEVLPGKEEFTVETLAGIMRPRLRVEGGKVVGIRVDMGAPSFERKNIPMVGEGSPLEVQLNVAGDDLTVSSILMGVPHAMVVVEDIENFPFEKWGPALEAHAAFPRKINVNFVQILDEQNVRVRTWERGAGPTMACGTGSCAVVTMLSTLGKVQPKTTVHLEAGDLIIEKTESTVFMTGPAEYVFRGTLA